MSNRYFLPCPLRRASTLLTLTLILLAKALPATASDWPWVLEVDANYTCTGTTVSYNHTDIHKGTVTFQMPEEAGPVSGKKGGFNYHTTGQSMGRPWSFSSPGEFYFTGEVTPGHLRFTPRVRLPDGTDFYKPHLTHTMPIYDGATFETAPASNADVSCAGYVRYTLRGKPREKYRINVDDRLLRGEGLGVYSGKTYRTQVTIQVLTEIELTVEDEKIKSVSGTRRVGRITPAAEPAGVWTLTLHTGKCPEKTASYPYATPISNAQISAAVRDKSTISLAVPKGSAGGAFHRKIDPKLAKVISPGIQTGQASRFNRLVCFDQSLTTIRWAFTRRRNSVTTTEDTFDHLQTFSVTQMTTATGLAPGQSTGLQPSSKFFGGDRAP